MPIFSSLQMNIPGIFKQNYPWLYFCIIILCFYLSHVLMVLYAYFCEKLVNFGRIRQNLMNKIWLRRALGIA